MKNIWECVSSHHINRHTDRRRQTARASYCVSAPHILIYRRSFSTFRTISQIQYATTAAIRLSKKEKKKTKPQTIFHTTAQAAETKRHKTEHVVGISIFRSLVFLHFYFILLLALWWSICRTACRCVCMFMQIECRNISERTERRKRRKAKSKRYYANLCEPKTPNNNKLRRRENQREREREIFYARPHFFSSWAIQNLIT